VLYSFLWLYLATVGGGAWSIDAWLARRRAAAMGTGGADTTP
jgi:hypothetical protein